MADSKLLQQMLEHLVNDEQQKAEELFHEYVVSKSREIYEGLIETEISEEEKEDEDEDVEEAAKDEDAEDDKVDEEFEDVAYEGDDEMGPDMGGDATDDLEGDLDAEMGDEEGEKDEAELFQDLEDIVDELQAKFDELKGVESGEHGDDFGDEGEEGGNPFAKEEGINDLETVREYVEQVGGKQYNQFGKMGDNGTNTKSIVAGKNDMGGTASNIAQSKTESGVEANKGQLQGSSLIKQTPTEDNAGNINVPGGKAGNAFSKKEPGHGAEKAGAKETADNKQSLFRGRR
jgi:hypothetical protein